MIKFTGDCFLTHYHFKKVEHESVYTLLLRDRSPQGQVFEIASNNLQTLYNPRFQVFSIIPEETLKLYKPHNQ